MRVIVGLGNPGQQYKNTRHNIGFEMVEKLQEDFGFPEFSFNKKFNAEISEGIYHSDKLLLVKPQTFMNLSGVSVQAMLDFFKLTPNDIIVVHDDIDIEIGAMKIATDSRSAGHNGVQNIIDALGTQKFIRLRIGIRTATVESPSCKIGVHDFVLGKFSLAEKDALEKISATITEAIQNLL